MASLSTRSSQTDQVRTYFRSFDKNGDGTVSREEFAAVFNTMSSEESDKMFSRIDKNRNGVIDYSEFIDWVMAPSDSLSSQCQEAARGSAEDPETHHPPRKGDPQMAEDVNWRKLRPDLVRLFEEVSDNGATLDEAAYTKGIMLVCPHLSKEQVTAMWVGYCEGTGRDEWTMNDFCVCAEAAETGDEEAAEFADLVCDDFTLLGAVGKQTATSKWQVLQVEHDALAAAKLHALQLDHNALIEENELLRARSPQDHIALIQENERLKERARAAETREANQRVRSEALEVELANLEAELGRRGPGRVMQLDQFLELQ